jgi:hypothetical protein
VRGVGGICLFLGVACLLVAAVGLLFPQLTETVDEGAARYARHAEDGTAPKVEVLAEPRHVPWALLVSGAALVVVGLRVRRAP